MKQMIVLIAMIALGIAIAGLVMSFSNSAKSLADEAKAGITYSNLSGN